MATHSDTTELLDNTISTLSNGSISVSAMEGTSLIDQWINALQEGENTREFAAKLQQLRQALDNPSPHSENIRGVLEDLATSLTELNTEVGPEGEIPYQLQSLATALRNVSNQLSSAE